MDQVDRCFTRSHAALGLSKSILALGEADFGATLFDSIRQQLPVDMYSAFVITGVNQLQLVLAGGTSRAKADFPKVASQRYAGGFWRRDPLLQRLLSTSVRRGISKSQSWQDIPCSEYRDFCYERPGVVDRVSIYQDLGSSATLVNLYRFRSSGYFKADEIARLDCLADMVPALIAKHALLEAQRESKTLHPPIQALTATMRALNRGLSDRESQVCAAMLAGMPIKDISRQLGVEISTVVTYKKRAFEKLGVSTRRELRSYYEMQLSESH